MMRADTAAAAVPISLLRRSGRVREVLVDTHIIPLRPGTDEVYVPHLRKVIHDQLKQEDAASAPWHWSCVSLDRVVSSATGEDAVLERNPLTIKFRELIPAAGAADISVQIIRRQIFTHMPLLSCCTSLEVQICLARRRITLIMQRNVLSYHPNEIITLHSCVNV